VANTANSERCYEVLLYYFIGYLNEDKIIRDYLQRDSATDHTARVYIMLMRHVRVTGPQASEVKQRKN
jgi:hypothetical protein